MQFTTIISVMGKKGVNVVYAQETSGRILKKLNHDSYQKVGLTIWCREETALSLHIHLCCSNFLLHVYILFQIKKKSN